MSSSRSVASFLFAVSVGIAGPSEAVETSKLDAPLIAAFSENPSGTQRVLIRLNTDPAHAGIRLLAPSPQRVEQLFDQLTTASERAQRELTQWLDARSINYRVYWLGNVISVEADRSLVDAIAARDDVSAILIDRVFRNPLPQPVASTKSATRGVEGSLTHIRVPMVWDAGIRGQGIVIAGQDTGYQWNHPALRETYRGWDGVNASHDYHWHDAIRELIGGGTNRCGLDSSAPCDDHNHGTHTMGTMVGDDGMANQIGIATAAKWIGCRNMEAGEGRPSTYIECFQWFIAPTDLDDANPRPDLAPHVINNSWGCVVEEGCTPTENALIEDVVDAVRAAGILVVASAGNSGPGCGSVESPPAIHGSSFTVGATLATSDSIWSGSSRGPTLDGLLKPDVTAPGAGIRSSITNNGYASFTGTSMAGPHVAGVAALLMEANPSLIRNPGAVETILRQTAVPLTSAQSCGSFSGSVVPNVVFGHGRIDAWAAFRTAETIFVDPFE